jgi:pimeloyl-ACP methyl ester carboxylesterase
MNAMTKAARGALTDGTTPGGPVDVARREPVGRVVGASVAAGLIGALMLTLGVFGGATEPVISGSALLAFAGGWALLAKLSVRFTSQPQPWAWVPAGAMAAAGVALIAAEPGDGALNAAGWVWSPAAIALAVWIFVQLRRNLAGRVRWLLYPVVIAIVVGSVGAMYTTVARVRDAHDYLAPGALYDVGGHRLHLYCVGSGGPTVVLQNGLGGVSVLWSRITDEVSRTARVCAYDRAGQGWSDDVDSPQDGQAIAADLHTLLQRAGEDGPYVLVGHSAGGAYAMIYAAQYPDEVAGMVLLDSMTPYQFSALPDFASQYSMMRRGLGVTPSLARLGITQVLPASAFSDLPEPAASQVRAFASSPRKFRSMRDEQSVYPTVLRQAQALTTLDGKPLVVVTASESQRKTKGWTDAQDRLAELSTNSQHRFVEATHDGVVDNEDSYGPSVQAIVDVVGSIRQEWVG